VALSAPERAAQELPRAPGRAPTALDLGTLLPERSAEDILAGQVRVHLGSRGPARVAQTYVLPVLSIAANRKWKESLEGGLQQLLATVDAAGDDLATILAAFSTATPQLLDLLYGYDDTHVLPERERLEEEATDIEVLMATLEVWSAANPFAGVALALARGAEEPLTGGAQANGSSQPMSSARPSTAGRRRSSRHS